MALKTKTTWGCKACGQEFTPARKRHTCPACGSWRIAIVIVCREREGADHEAVR
jgi:predicted RNA-binding Zn-ribbon protein involved in translation (DUF1610 family)